MYPSHYLGNNTLTDEFEMESIEFDDTNNVTPNREKIMELLLNDNYEDINKIVDIVELDDDYADDYDLKPDITLELLNSCINDDDIEMFKILLLKNGQVQILENYIDVVGHMVDENRLNMFMILIDDIDLDTFYETIYGEILICRDNTIPFLKIMDERGYKMDNKHIKRIILCNNIETMKYLLEIGYDIQIHVNNSNIAMDIIRFDMLKCLVDWGIDIKNCLILVIGSAIKHNNLDMMIYLVEHFPDHSLNKYLGRCVRLNRIDILKYLMSVGVNIHRLKIVDCSDVNIDMVKFLIGVGYNITKLVDKLGHLLIRCFCGDSGIENFKYLLDIGVNVLLLTQNEKTDMTEEYKRWVIYKSNYVYLRSPTEYCVSMGKMTQIKFLFDNYYELVGVAIDRLFVIACANGQIEMVRYFKEMDAKLCEKSLASACYFGHFEIVKMLLCYGLEFGDMVENPFVLCVKGMHNVGQENEPYTNLIKDNDIFRNHIYNYGNGYDDILKLLVVCNVCVPHYDNVGVQYLMELDVGTIRYFLDGGMNINLRFEYKNVMMSLLEYTVLKNIKMVKFLLDAGIECHVLNINVVNKCHKEKYMDIKQLLLDAGFDL